MSEKISFQDTDGKQASGLFKVSDGMITVTAPDGHTRTVDIDESMLCPETLAKMLLSWEPKRRHMERQRT